MNILKITKIAAMAMGLAVASQVAQAQTLFNVDAGTGSSPVYTGAAVLGSSGDVWNAKTSWGVTTLQDSTGSSAAGVTFDAENMPYYGFDDATGGSNPTSSALMEDYIFAGGAGDGWPIKFTLANLPASRAFTLVVYSAGDTVGQGATINLTDSSFSTISQSATTTGANRDITSAQGVCWQEFNGITSADGHIYFDVANTATWHAFNGLQLLIAAAQQIAVGVPQISPTNTVFAGEPVVLSCGVSGPVTGYHWEWDNGTGGAFTRITGATGLTYTQATTGLLGSYQYQFVATNSSASVTSSIVTLTVNAASAPFVTSDTAPSSATLYTGGTVTFTATFDGNHPITNQWQKSTDSGTTWVNLSGRTNTTLTLTNLQFSDAGMYRLAATNAIGNNASTAATLTVNDVSSAKYQWSAPVPFNGLNADKILTNSAGAFVGAAAFGNAAYLVTLGNGRVLDFTTDSSIASATGGGLATGAYPAGTGVTTSNANFDAVLNGFSWDGGPKTIYVNNLTVGEKYSVQIFGVDDRFDGGGESNRLANFQDPADAADVSATFKMGDNVYVVGTFTASNTTENIQMNLPTGNAGSINALVLRALSYTPANQPPTVLTDPQSKTAFAGHPVSFTVIANSYILPGYQWQAGPVGGPFTNLNNGGIIVGATNAVLVLTNAAAYDGAQFQVVVSNPAGSVTSGAATLTIVPVPPTSGSASAAVKALSPVAYWPLNETNDPSSGLVGAYDAAGTFDGMYLTAAQNAFNGIVGPQSADGYPQFASGQGALQTTVNTDQSWVTTPALNLNTNTVTIGMWIYPNGDQTGPAGLYVNRNSGTVAGLGYYSTNRLGYKWNNDGSETWGFNTGPVIPTNIWSYVAVAITPTNAILYLINTNGIQSATNTVTHNNMSWGGDEANISIGHDNYLYTVFNGKIDEVAVFNHALSASQIQGLTGLVFVNTDPATANFTASVSGQTLNFSWAADHKGWQLYTNAVGLTATGSWYPVPGSASGTSQSITVNPTQPNVFFQLRYP
jgi:hypothetical protein